MSIGPATACISDALPFVNTSFTNSLNDLQSEEENNKSMVAGVLSNEESSNLKLNVDVSTMSIVDERKLSSSDALVAHININSIQNKFDELTSLNETLKSHVLIISDTKIDGSFQRGQFALSGYGR